MDKLTLKLAIIANEIDAGKKPYVSFTVSIHDKKKTNGSYKEIEGAVKKSRYVS